jgi:hypothetical protein
MLSHTEIRNPSTGSSLNTPPTEGLRHGICVVRMRTHRYR